MAVAAAQASVLQSFPFRAAAVALCVLLLPPLFPSPEGLAGGQALLAKAWELLHLLLVGIAVSYGLFSRRNATAGGDDKDAAALAAAQAKQQPEDARYVSQMLHDSLVFDDDAPPDSPAAAEVRSWSAMHRADEPVVVVSNGGGGRSHAAHAQQQQQPLSLPVRALRQQPGQGDSSDGAPRARRSSREDMADETVLPSPIPWRSRSGRFDVSPSPSPTRLSPASSLSNETLTKATDDNAAAKQRRSPYKSSSLSSPPPAPPPPPPPFLVHGYHPIPAERRTAAKSFKEELEDHSKKGRRRDHHFPPSSTTSSAKPRSSSIDASSSSSSSPSSYSVGRSVRTIRAREAAAAAATQSQSQEQPDDGGGTGDEALGLHGSDEPYGYQAYQSIPRFQYERGSDPILGKVTVSSESSDDDDDDNDGETSTRASSPRTPEVDENEVDKKAEEFIARFREQIRLQRIESIKKSAGPRGVKHGK